VRGITTHCGYLFSHVGNFPDMAVCLLFFSKTITGECQSLKRFEHFKLKTIYEMVGETVPTNAPMPEGAVTEKTVTAWHHDTQEPMTFTKLNVDGFYVSPNEETYVLYQAENTVKWWAREYDDFYGDKELPDGTFVRRFKPLFEEGKYIKPQADIKIPENYLQLLEKTTKEYKKWLKANDKLQEIANNADTDEERTEALKEVTRHFKDRYAGVLAKDTGDRLSISKITRIWEKFISDEYRGFMNAHLNLTMTQIMNIGIDKFIYVMGWKRPTDVVTWHNNKLRIGVCCHCNDQFIPMMFQYNNGLCANCRPLYSHAAIRNFVIRQLNVSERYEEASRDLLMDFYIMFYHDEKLRKLFLVGTESAKEFESFQDELPTWAQKDLPQAEITEELKENESTEL
jgi:hypothetical protein